MSSGGRWHRFPSLRLQPARPRSRQQKVCVRKKCVGGDGFEAVAPALTGEDWNPTVWQDSLCNPLSPHFPVHMAAARMKLDRRSPQVACQEQPQLSKAVLALRRARQTPPKNRISVLTARVVITWSHKRQHFHSLQHFLEAALAKWLRRRSASAPRTPK